jgi:hypothetical protein
LYTTVPIYVVNGTRQPYETINGTGFWYRTNDTKPREYVVTCRHILDRKNIRFVQLTLFRSRKEPRYEYHVADLKSIFFSRPLSTDLAAIPVEAGMDSRREFWTEKDITGQDGLRAIEEVYSIGYPKYGWDIRNNKPIVRRGITASDPNDDFNGGPTGIVDMASIQGGSGGPIFILTTFRVDRDCNIVHGTFVQLLGVFTQFHHNDSHRGVYVKAREVRRMLMSLEVEEVSIEACLAVLNESAMVTFGSLSTGSPPFTLALADWFANLVWSQRIKKEEL